MSGYSDPGFDTLAVHAGAAPDPATGARAVPIHLTTSFVFESSDQAAALFNLERAGHIYTRISNPTIAVLEERLAALESGVGAVCTASGEPPGSQTSAYFFATLGPRNGRITPCRIGHHSQRLSDTTR